ncbi:MAG: hypothetical protein JXM79_01755 [Sedimentisphaerales bacterium]|nr:hypothetical protein [Sedimentisphaerales bacterium]
MDKKIIEQLAGLAEAFNKIQLKPVICGGLGIYLCFHKSQSQDRQLLRATTDIDLMLTESQVLEQAQRQAIAEIITDQLQYVVREGHEHIHFQKNDDQFLDILAPPMDEFRWDEVRIKLVSSKLHGRVTKEACFIEEDLRTISLSDFLPNCLVRVRRVLRGTMISEGMNDLFGSKLAFCRERSGSMGRMCLQRV